ncbi:host-nuclease inhibitor Gam family protein [Helicobacter sp. 14348-15]|uniref:host-nuclease inhibitor Gam family protein n=1 Tax=Helicobacter colisuis TaxID=2949739 RepID=UPI00202B0EEE|nr:host-nuclease inhibitor Gam family protein [Helicobacter colisuis]MCL9820956.1 host-nuclease inhibitor Gam family protein [Helicobacter colisuis]
MEIKNYEDVNLTLKRLAELVVNIERINGEVTLECNRIKEARTSEIEKLENEKKYLEQCISSFCEDNKADFADKRSKEFTFGTIGYKLSKSVSIPRVKEKLEKLIKAIKSYGHSECIIYEEKIDKDVLVELDDSSLVKLGLKRTIKDNFRIVPKIENLEIKD